MGRAYLLLEVNSEQDANQIFKTIQKEINLLQWKVGVN